MKPLLHLTLALVFLTGCAGGAPRDDRPQPEEEAAARSHGGKVVGGAGGAVAGGAMAYSSAGLLCTIGGPLCAIVVIPAAIIGGLIGMVAGSVADSIKDSTNDPANAEAPSVPAQPLADTSPPPGG